MRVVFVQPSRNGVWIELRRKTSLSYMLKSSKDIISARPMGRTHSSRKTFPGLVMVLVLPMEELRELIYLSGTAKANLEGL